LATDSAPFADRRHLATSLAYHSGKAWALGGNTVLSVLPGLKAEASSGLPHGAALGPVLHTAVTRQGAAWAAQVELVAEKFVAGSSLGRQAVRATGEMRLSRNLSLAVGASAQQAKGQTRPRERELLVSLKWHARSLARPWGPD